MASSSNICSGKFGKMSLIRYREIPDAYGEDGVSRRYNDIRLMERVIVQSQCDVAMRRGDKPIQSQVVEGRNVVEIGIEQREKPGLNIWNYFQADSIQCLRIVQLGSMNQVQMVIWMGEAAVGGASSIADLQGEWATVSTILPTGLLM